MKQVNSVMELIEQLSSVEYGWCDIDKNIYKDPEKGFKKKYVLSSPEEVLASQVGTCFDLVELERSCFKSLGIKCSSYFMVYYESKRIYSHTFIVYEENDKFYWLENTWLKFKGIHEYLSLYDLLTDVREKFKLSNDLKFMDLDYLCIYKYKKPKFHIGLKDFYKHCESGENIII